MKVLRIWPFFQWNQNLKVSPALGPARALPHVRTKYRFLDVYSDKKFTRDYLYMF